MKKHRHSTKHKTIDTALNVKIVDTRNIFAQLGFSSDGFLED